MKMSKFDIPGNNNYYLTGENVVHGYNGVVDIPVRNNKVTIPLYGVSYKLDFTWLVDYAKHQVFLRKGYTIQIPNIKFEKTELSSHGLKHDKLPLFKKPVYYIQNNEFRVLAMYPGLAISEKGVLVNIDTGKTSIPGSNINTYPRVTIYDPSLGRAISIGVHRLVALAWVENDDYVTKPIVDHNNGDKTDYRASNLEWVSFSENSNRMVKQGLRTDNIDVKVKDYEDNVVTIFGTMTQACEFMGRARINRIEEFCGTPTLVNDRYQIKLLSDKSDWDFDKGQLIKVVFKDTTKEYRTIKELMEDLFPGISPRQNRKYIIDKLRKEDPNSSIFFPKEKKDSITKTYQLLDTSNGKIYESNSLGGFCKYVKLAKGTITNAFHAGEETEVSGISVRVKTDREWKKILYHKGRRNIGVLVIELSSGITHSFDSLRKIADFLNVDRKTVSNAIVNKRTIYGYSISYT